MALAGPLARRGHRPHPGLASGRRPRGALAPARPAVHAARLPGTPRAARRGRRESSLGRAVRRRAVLTTARSVRMIAGAARDFDLVHSNSLWAHLDCALAGRLARRPSVIELYDLVRPGLGRRVLTAGGGAVDDGGGHQPGRRRHASGPAGRAMSASCRCRSTSTGSAPGPSLLQVRRHLTSDETAPLVGIVGRIDPEKGVDVLVQAMGLLQGAGGRCASRRGGQCRARPRRLPRAGAGRGRATSSATGSASSGVPTTSRARCAPSTSS